ncbi:MAG: hypothetical protein WEE36_09150 [Acidimicrobiia bacterium]
MSTTRLPDGIGRTIFIAALAGVMFAAFLLVTPRLTASTGPTTGGDGDASTTTTSARVTTTTAAPTTTTAAVPGTTLAPTPTTVPPLSPEDGYDGTVTLGIYFEGQGDGKEFGVIEDGDQVTWRLHVTNTSDGRLWGVYAYVELYGPARCDTRILEPGESTDCWVEGRAFEGTQQVEAWVNAWTLTRMVKDKVFVDMTVLP